MSEEINNPDTNFRIVDKRSPETQARKAERPDHIGGTNEMKLKPCPFCGSSAKAYGPYIDDTYSVICDWCYMETEKRATKSTVIAIWNRRAPEPETGIYPQPAILYAALLELVRLKDRKDVQGKDAEYLRDQPLAWKAAREAIVANIPEPPEGMR